MSSRWMPEIQPTVGFRKASAESVASRAKRPWAWPPAGMMVSEKPLSKASAVMRDSSSGP